MDPLERLARLQRRRLDEDKRALSEISAEIAAVEQRLVALRAQRADEIAHSGPDPVGVRLLAVWLQASAGRERGLEAECQRLERRRAAAIARLTDRRVELRRLELLLERRSERATEAAARAEQRALHDLAAARHARARQGRT